MDRFAVDANDQMQHSSPCTFNFCSSFVNFALFAQELVQALDPVGPVILQVDEWMGTITIFSDRWLR